MNDNYDYGIYVRPSMPPGSRFSFTSREIRELAISAAVLSAAFTIAFAGIGVLLQNPWAFLSLLPTAMVTISLAFVLHELSHKFLAQRYGAHSEYRMSVQGLVIALLTALIGFVYAAPGAVVISGYLTTEQYGKVSVAGPLTNLFLAAVFFSISTGLGMAGLGRYASLAHFATFINVFLAAFNMLPFGPLDGRKVWRWSKPVYVIVAGTALLSLLRMWGIL